MSFDLWLRRRMAEHEGTGINARDLGKAIGANEATVGRWIDGDKQPSRRYVLKLAQFFRVSPATILRQTDPEEFAALARDLVAQEAEMNEIDREVAAALQKLSPERRAAFLLLLREDDAKGGKKKN